MSHIAPASRPRGRDDTKSQSGYGDEDDMTDGEDDDEDNDDDNDDNDGDGPNQLRMAAVPMNGSSSSRE